MVGIHDHQIWSLLRLQGRRMVRIWSADRPPKSEGENIYPVSESEVVFVSNGLGLFKPTEPLDLRIQEVDLNLRTETSLRCKIPRGQDDDRYTTVLLPGRRWPTLFFEDSRDGAFVGRDDNGQYLWELVSGAGDTVVAFFEHMGRMSMARWVWHKGTVAIRQGDFLEPSSWHEEEIPYDPENPSGPTSRFFTAGQFRGDGWASLVVDKSDGIYLYQLEDRAPHSSRTLLTSERWHGARVGDLNDDGFDDLVLFKENVLQWQPGHREGLQDPKPLRARPFVYAIGFSLQAKFPAVVQWKGKDVLVLPTTNPEELQIVRPHRPPFVVQMPIPKPSNR